MVDEISLGMSSHDFLPHWPLPQDETITRPVTVVLLHSPRGGEASLHTTLASALPHCDTTRGTISRILMVDKYRQV